MLSNLLVVATALLVSATPPTQHRGHPDADHQADMQLFHYLLDHRDSIRRTVTPLDNGVETLTESDDPEVAARIREHVRSMSARIEQGRPLHARDPLFRKIFKHADKIEMVMTPTDRGIRVRETSADPWVARLVQEHATVVDAFVANGRAEMRRNHGLRAAPDRQP